MILFPRIAAALLLMLGGCVQAAAPPPAETLPADSLHRLDTEFTDQSGRTFRLADNGGRPRLVAMFYTGCKYICPLIIDSAKGVEHALTPAERDGLSILLVSIDPERDDVDALKRVFDKRRLDPSRWTLARTEAAGVRKLAALLGVRYRALADGEFNHTSELFLLDRDGRRIAGTTRLGATPDPEFVAAVRAAVGAGSDGH